MEGTQIMNSFPASSREVDDLKVIVQGLLDTQPFALNGASKYVLVG